MGNKKNDIKNRYSDEIQHINNKIQQLEKGRIYEFTKAQMDGYLNTNITQLKEMIEDLIEKIEYGVESNKEILRKTLDEIEKY